MIQRKDLLTFQFYKKEKFTGSCCGTRYLIQKEQNGDEDIFAVYTWPGPYNFAVTAKELKVRKEFLFAELSLEEITDYLNLVCKK